MSSDNRRQVMEPSECALTIFSKILMITSHKWPYLLKRAKQRENPIKKSTDFSGNFYE